MVRIFLGFPARKVRRSGWSGGPVIRREGQSGGWGGQEGGEARRAGQSGGRGSQVVFAYLQK